MVADQRASGRNLNRGIGALAAIGLMKRWSMSASQTHAELFENGNTLDKAVAGCPAPHLCIGWRRAYD